MFQSGTSEILGAETSVAEDENHWMLALQFGELPASRGMVGKFIVGEGGPWNQCQIAFEILQSWMHVAGYW
jgi:hypothetical protein